MAGQVLRIIPITKFTQAAAGGATTQRVAQHVDVSQWAAATLMTRVHAGNTSETFNVKVYADGFTEEDPGTDFKGSSTLADADLSGASAGDYVATALSGAMGAMLIVEVAMSSSNNAIDLDISIDLSLKDA